MTLVKSDGTTGYLAAQCAVSTQQQLLAGLAAGIKGSAHLCTTERAIVEGSTVVTGKGNTLSNTLVDDVVAHLSQTVDVSLAGTVVATLDGVVEKTVDGVAIILVVLGSVDTTLGSN